MNALSVVLALIAAMTNGGASVLQRRAAIEQKDQENRDGQRRGDADGGGDSVAEEGGDGGRDRRRSPSPVRSGLARLVDLLHRPYWLTGTAALVVSGGCQAGALAVGRLSVVQPLLATELLFTLVIGSIVFHHTPDRRTWLSFLMLAVGLGTFLISASPTAGTATSDAGRWLPTGACVAAVIALLLLAASRFGGSPRAALLGCASAVSFSATAAFMKEVTGRLGEGWVQLLTTGYLYVGCAVGLLSFLLLQSALRAGSLAASQPALTLGDAMSSVVLGWALFQERVMGGLDVLPEVLGVCLMVLGAVGLSRSPAVAGNWDTTEDAAEGAATREETSRK
ncbi:DMT family transporter [Streptomyces sp. NRRL F-5126]|uniref:DMT family transporter n=1 Tax=Streptomyces sp. NRRL F-5126 TaxID=1463857 RepID=UPI0004C6A89A|nr:DMT family transporter [Streptomyces sp. NRRL F-5126]